MDLGEHPQAAPAGAGADLRIARERAGLSLDEVAARTRIPTRHLAAIEEGDLARLPAPTYAVGFARAYARAVGADEVAIAQKVRGEVERTGRRVSDYTPYEIADPARVPSRGVAIVAAGLALAVLVLVGLWYGTTLFRPGAPATVAPVATRAEAPVARPTAAPAVPAGGGQVTLTATDEVWMRVTDASGAVLTQGIMKAGDRFDVPSTATDPKINVGRPDKLQVTLNGSAMAPLGGALPIKNVGVGAAAVAARGAAGAAPAPSASPTPVAEASSPAAASAPLRRAPPRRLTEVQRANLQSLRDARSGR